MCGLSCLRAFCSCSLHSHVITSVNFPVVCWHGELYSAAASAQPQRVTLTLTFASGLQKSASWMTGDWLDLHQSPQQQCAKFLKAQNYLRIYINCGCRGRKAKHIHQGNIIKRNYCYFRPREATFTFIYYCADLHPISHDIWILIANSVSYFICIYAL